MVDVRDVHSLQFSFASKAKTLWSIDVEWKTLSFYSFNSSLNKNKGENVIAFIFKNELRHANPIYRVAILSIQMHLRLLYLRKKENKTIPQQLLCLFCLNGLDERFTLSEGISDENKMTRGERSWLLFQHCPISPPFSSAIFISDYKTWNCRAKKVI